MVPSLNTSPSPNPAECVFISAATAVGAECYWYCHGDNLNNLNPVYVGEYTKDGEWERHTFNGTESELLPFRGVAPPSNPVELVKSGEMLAIPVKDTSQATKGYVLLQRPLTPPFETKEMPFDNTPGKWDSKIAGFIIHANDHYIEPKAKMAAPPSQLDFLKGLNGLFYPAVTEKHPETGKHFERMARLVKTVAEEINDTEGLTYKISPENLQLMEQLAWLHDIGKYQVPHNLLDAADLKSIEGGRERINKHSADSRDIIDVPLVDRNLSVMLSTHHMFPDGDINGYPYSLKNGGLDTKGHIHFRGNAYYPKPKSGVPEDPSEDSLPPKLSFEVGLLRVCDYFEAISAGRSYSSGTKEKVKLRTDDGKIIPSAVLKKLYTMAKEEKINPYAFYLFVNSTALINYCTDQENNPHLYTSKDENKEFASLRWDILSDKGLQTQARRFSIQSEPLLFTAPDKDTILEKEKWLYKRSGPEEDRAPEWVH